jgi:8-oxo-dGTP pyrophosphatase MutT (NUDIX family)/phosphohistidine phosphatase SixA
MPDSQAAAEIRAAGAVLWRPAGRGTQVALIHRPKYDDWSLPKGKLDAGEHALQAAVREVAEETGMEVTLGLHFPPVRYLVDGQPKVVDYWAAQVAASAAFVPNHEVDRLDWVALSQADGRLSYDHDVALLAEFAAAPRPTVPVILVRHSSAGSKSDWHKDDLLRPLDGRGKQQARMLAVLLGSFGAGRVLSSPAERCLGTVRPYAESIGVPVESVPELGLLPAGPRKKADREAAAAALEQAAASVAAAAARQDRPVVICGHRENMPVLLAAVCGQLGAQPPDGPPLRKGGFWVLHRAAGALAGAELYHPDDVRLPAGGSGRRAGGLPVQRRRQRAFQDQQPVLDLYPGTAAVATEAVAGQHAMARHDDRDGIGPHDLADRSRRGHVALGRQARAAGKCAVARGLAVAH